MNGEFYDYDNIRADLLSKSDYKFKGRSDSELVLALYKYYGLNFVHHLRGEFACVLFDEATQMFVAVRDRYGIKPLFWTIQEGRLLIAAEMKAFLPLGWKPEWDVKSLLDAGWNHDERTIFKGVAKVRNIVLLICIAHALTMQVAPSRTLPDMPVLRAHRAKTVLGYLLPRQGRFSRSIGQATCANTTSMLSTIAHPRI